MRLLTVHKKRKKQEAVKGKQRITERKKDFAMTLAFVAGHSG
jgi:hypothetical protein|tara:strand:- start:121 stop:246 length:126 start_codon:yes stop_codon:yes gene_type:complete